MFTTSKNTSPRKSRTAFQPSLIEAGLEERQALSGVTPVVPPAGSGTWASSAYSHLLSRPYNPGAAHTLAMSTGAGGTVRAAVANTPPTVVPPAGSGTWASSAYAGLLLHPYNPAAGHTL
jgi:hypothetical protein